MKTVEIISIEDKKQINSYFGKYGPITEFTVSKRSKVEDIVQECKEVYLHRDGKKIKIKDMKHFDELVKVKEVREETEEEKKLRLEAEEEAKKKEEARLAKIAEDKKKLEEAEAKKAEEAALAAEAEKKRIADEEAAKKNQGGNKK